MKLISYKPQVGTSYNFAAFVGNIFKLKVTESFELSFERLDGKYVPEKPKAFKENVTLWKFPNFVTPLLIEEIIRNTCFECGGLMKEGTVINSQPFHVPQGSGYMLSQTIAFPITKPCRKCTDCGHSHT